MLGKCAPTQNRLELSVWLTAQDGSLIRTVMLDLHGRGQQKAAGWGGCRPLVRIVTARRQGQHSLANSIGPPTAGISQCSGLQPASLSSCHWARISSL